MDFGYYAKHILILIVTGLLGLIVAKLAIDEKSLFIGFFAIMSGVVFIFTTIKLYMDKVRFKPSAKQREQYKKAQTKYFNTKKPIVDNPWKVSLAVMFFVPIALIIIVLLIEVFIGTIEVPTFLKGTSFLIIPIILFALTRILLAIFTYSMRQIEKYGNEKEWRNIQNLSTALFKLPPPINPYAGLTPEEAKKKKDDWHYEILAQRQYEEAIDHINAEREAYQDYCDYVDNIGTDDEY